MVYLFIIKTAPLSYEHPVIIMRLHYGNGQAVP